jgi:hypothetical protein
MGRWQRFKRRLLGPTVEQARAEAALRAAEAARCPTCPHPRELHNAFGCTARFCGCERTWIGGGWP